MAGVYDFDEDDIQPFPCKPSLKNRSHVSRSGKDAKQITACRKHQGKKSNEKAGKKNDNRSSPQSLESVRKASKCKVFLKSKMTQSFEASSKGEVTEELVKIQGCCLEVLSVSRYAKEEKLSEVTVAGEGLMCGKGMIQTHSLEFTFTADLITLKLLDDQDFTTIAWPLNDISGFSFRTCEETNENILELNLTTSGMKLLEQKLCSLLCKSESLCDRGSTLTTKIRSPYQSDQAREITSLCDGYKRLWMPEKIRRHKKMSLKEDLQEQKGADIDNLVGKGGSNGHVSRKGFKGNTAAWFDLIYPKGDPDAVLVTMDDFLLLNPHEFVSDTIIDFYIKYLQSRLPEHEKKRCYFFNSFFFRKLAFFDRDIAYDLEKTSSLFEHMKRWTRDINIFTKDFLFVPVLQSCHWSLVIVCYPNHLFNDEHQKCYKETVILHFDSMKGFHRGVEERIKEYLEQHWISIGRSRNDKSCNIKCLPAMVPQQTNYSDCGLFMLHYVEMFLSALQSQLSTILVSRDWFDPEDVASKRSMLQRLIKEMQDEETAAKSDTAKHETVFIEDVSMALRRESEESCFEAAVLYTPQADRSCYLQTADCASHKRVRSEAAHTAAGNQHSKALAACQAGAAIRPFHIDHFREPLDTKLMENNHSCDLRSGKDGRESIDTREDLDISSEELNKTHKDKQSEGFATNAKEAKSREVDEMQISWQTVETSPEEEDVDDEPYNLSSCEHGAAQGREATQAKGSLVDKLDHTQDEAQACSAGESLHHAQASQLQQVYISSDEESGFVKVQKMVEASKFRQQRRTGRSEVLPAPTSASGASKGKEKQLLKDKWRNRRKSQFHLH